MYLGLLCCTALFVYAVTGIEATTYTRPAEREKAPVITRYEAFSAPASGSDAEVARAAAAKLAVPLTGPPGQIRRDDGNNLQFNLYPPNGLVRVTLLESESRVRVEATRQPFGRLLGNLHEVTMRNPSGDIRMKLWKYYNEFAMWCLMLMVVSGIFLWLSSRPGHKLGLLSFAAGAAALVLILAAGRIF